MTQTGYWASENGHRSGIHVRQGGRPLCGYKPAKRMQFQWCANCVHLFLVTCKKCKRLAKENHNET